jgi:hypothetical protein
MNILAVMQLRRLSARFQLCTTFNEFVEAAGVASRRFVLMQKCEIVLVEDLEELVPGNFFQLVVGLAEVDPEQAAPPMS